MTIDEILQKPHWVIDILPKQVPENTDGQFFTIEKYFTEDDRMVEIKKKHINLILKLNCYMAISIDDETNPAPAKVAREMHRRYVWIRIGASMIISEPNDAHMTIFNPDAELLEMVKMIASGEGLYVWQPEFPGL